MSEEVPKEIHIKHMEEEIYLLFVLFCVKCSTQFEKVHSFWDEIETSQPTENDAMKFSQMASQAAYDSGWRCAKEGEPKCPKCI